MKKKGRCTQEEQEERLGEVEAALAKGIRSTQIERHFSKLWTLSHRQVRNYIAEVRAKWRELALKEDPSTIAERRFAIREQLSELMQMSIQRKTNGAPDPDVRNAVGCIRALMDLDGLQVDKKLVLEHQGSLKVQNGYEGKTADQIRHFIRNGTFEIPPKP